MDVPDFAQLVGFLYSWIQESHSTYYGVQCLDTNRVRREGARYLDAHWNAEFQCPHCGDRIQTIDSLNLWVWKTLNGHNILILGHDRCSLELPPGIPASYTVEQYVQIMVWRAWANHPPYRFISEEELNGLANCALYHWSLIRNDFSVKSITVRTDPELQFEFQSTL